MRTWILPMAGKGTRTLEHGRCKPAIIVSGRPIFAWCLTGLANLIMPNDSIIAITTKSFDKDYNLTKNVERWIDLLSLDVDFKMILTNHTPPGPAASVFEASHLFNTTNHTIIVNPDQFIQFKIPDTLEINDAFVPLYVNSTGKSSYAHIDNGIIKHIVEKELISCYASAGVYGFGSGKVLFELLGNALSGPFHYNHEYFVGPSINTLIESGGKVFPSTVIAKYDLGTVEQINDFIKMVDLLHRSEYNETKIG